MNLDERIPGRCRDKALSLFLAAGFDRASSELLREASIRTILWTIAGTSKFKQRTASELLECAIDPEAA